VFYGDFFRPHENVDLNIFVLLPMSCRIVASSMRTETRMCLCNVVVD
jgi:hypothetical protein